MKRVLGVLLVVSLLSGCSYLGIGAPALPWKTQDEMKADVVSQEIALCSGAVSAPGMLMKVGLIHGETKYLIFFEPESLKFVGAELDAAGQPVRIFTGQIVAGKVTVTASHPFDVSKDGGPCQVMFPQAAH